MERKDYLCAFINGYDYNTIYFVLHDIKDFVILSYMEVIYDDICNIQLIEINKYGYYNQISKNDDQISKRISTYKSLKKQYLSCEFTKKHMNNSVRMVGRRFASQEDLSIFNTYCGCKDRENCDHVLINSPLGIFIMDFNDDTGCRLFYNSIPNIKKLKRYSDVSIIFNNN